MPAEMLMLLQGFLAAVSQKVLILLESKLFLFVRDLEMSVLTFVIANQEMQGRDEREGA